MCNLFILQQHGPFITTKVEFALTSDLSNNSKNTSKHVNIHIPRECKQIYQSVNEPGNFTFN